jgi:hypothetical protein
MGRRGVKNLTQFLEEARNLASCTLDGSRNDDIGPFSRQLSDKGRKKLFISQDGGLLFVCGKDALKMR